MLTERLSEDSRIRTQRLFEPRLVSGEHLSRPEETLIIVKPDGVSKGLIGELLQGLAEHKLAITQVMTTQLSREWVEELYEPERGQSYFEEVVEWVSSAPVVLMKIQGEGAVDKVKWQIVGRYPDGMRGRYSENWIKNVAHAPDSLEAANRELRLAEEIFTESNIDKERFRGKKVFALTGMSESGKSTVGKYLDSRGIPRLKIGDVFGRIRDERSPRDTVDDFVKREEQKNPFALWDAFADKLVQIMDERDVNMVSIESLYGGGLGPYLKLRMGDNFDIVYVHIPQYIRLQRQMERQNLDTLEEAWSFLSPRDKVKARSGIPRLRRLAGEVIDNSGRLEDLHTAVDGIVERHRKMVEAQ